MNNPPDPWDSDRYSVETPERIDLEYDVASLGSRLPAAMVDTLLVSVLAGLLMILGAIGLAAAIGVVAGLTGIGASSQTLGTVALAGALLLAFGVIWGYYVFFELVWHGQSPGKRMGGLRVIKEGGYPLGFVDSAIRNLVRIIDFLPSFYIIGAMVMFVDRRSRRLGDLAAGTLVVKERRDLRLDSLPSPSPAPAAAPAEPESAPTEEGAILNVHRLTPADQSLLREYLLRRPAMAAPAATALAARLAAAFARKLDHDPGSEPPESFLARLAEQAGKRH